MLQLEAAVQRDMSNARKWFELGVKQQENEREKQALQALKRAVELDPSHLPSWLALSVSHTNDGNRQAACDAIREWVMRNDNYAAPVKEFFAKSPEAPRTTMMVLSLSSMLLQGGQHHSLCAS